MPESVFIDRILQKIDKIDRSNLQHYLLDLAKEKDFLNEVLDGMPEGVLVIDREERITLANQSAKSLLGLSHSLHLSGSVLASAIADKALYQFLITHLRTQSYVIQHELDILTPHHSYVSVSITPFYNRSGGQEGSIVLLNNTTLPREQEREQSRIEKVESLISLARGVAHEIGNPLNAITIHLRLLQQEIESLPAEKKKNADELARIITAETQRLANIVRNFLTATRRKPPQFSDEDINDVIRNAVKVLEPEMKDAGVKTVLKLSRSIPPMLLDSEKMHQVLINLLKNAIESMPEGGNLEIISSKNEKICSVKISDEGIGIPQEYLPHVFGAYYTSKSEGSGLGLLIVHNIIKEHNGRIEIQSKQGKGTCVTIHLPIRQGKISLPDNLKER